MFGGVFDDEFKSGSIVFFDQIAKGVFIPVISPITEKEIALAPRFVIDEFVKYIELFEVLPESMEAIQLQNKYLAAQIVSLKYMTDALYVALATISNCNAIISWNFKHLVNFNKISQYNAIKMMNGYKPINIHTPLEIINYEE